jgi:hypothetical protein
MWRALVLPVLGAWSAALAGHGGDVDALPDLSTPEAFDRHVRPILSDHCFACHGPDSNAREADLRLDLLSSVRDSGVVVPGDSSASELVHRVTTDDEWDVMPPPEAKDALTERERAILVGWVEAGAPWAEHWAFVAPERPPVPSLDDPGVRNAIDAFVRARLAEQDLEPSPEAEPVVLLRRLMLALTGLPPTLDEVAAFEFALAEGADADGLLDAWVERVFTTEPYRTRFAEHRTRPWLDAARYADTIGIHTDNSWQAWSWRDWVVDSFRTGKPFDQFIVEQLAGDLLPGATEDQQVATGFHRLHVVTDEGGAISEEYLVEYAVDRVATTGSVLMGLTLGCARCHDHKYDPVSQEDFYGLYAFFDDVDQPGLYSQNPGEPERAFEPFIALNSAEVAERIAGLDGRLAELRSELEQVTPEERRQLEAFEAELAGAIDWHATRPLAAHAAEGSEIVLEGDGSARLEGELNHGEVIELVFELTGTVDTFLFEALPSDGLGGSGGIGRAPNGNGVIRQFVLELERDGQRERLALEWIAADHEQPNDDFVALNALEDNGRFWAFDYHRVGGSRWALVTLAEPVELRDGERLILTVDSRSPYAHHVPARPRVTFGDLAEEARALLPIAIGRLQRSDGFVFGEVAEGYEGLLPPERAARIERGVDLPGEDGRTWRWSFDPSMVDGEPFTLESTGREAIVLGRELVAPTPRTVGLSLGSDDGFVLRIDGELVAQNRVDRGVAADQDSAQLPLAGGRQLLTQRIVNTGGLAGAYQRFERASGVLSPSTLALALPPRAQGPFIAAAHAAWRREWSPRYAELEAELIALEGERQAALDSRPRAMVMREAMEPREAFVLLRGDYRTPDESRPVQPTLPAVLGELPADASRDRLGLARWIVSEDNPLTARVLVNRLWAEFFGTGLVTTTDDLGLQGERPTHPELLDWLALEFVESGWDLRHVVGLILNSATWRQDSAWRADLQDVDPDDRLLARYPRRRLPAEAIRDQALFTSGLLVDQVGGPPVKPYQPDGLWQEVAMLASNTRFFERDEGQALWRRSLYTFWKRAAPPPSMLAFDAPTREFCVVERSRTDTPLQALVLLNDEQFVEAARQLASQVLSGAADEGLVAQSAVRGAVEALFRRVLSRRPTDTEGAALESALEDFRARYAADPDAAEALLAVGASMRDERLDPAELAAWTLLASAVLNLYESTDPR